MGTRKWVHDIEMEGACGGGLRTGTCLHDKGRSSQGARDGATGGHLANPVAKKLFSMLNGWQSSPVTLNPCEVTEGIMTTTELVGNGKESSQGDPTLTYQEFH
jgi:hypothetical protein